MGTIAVIAVVRVHGLHRGQVAEIELDEAVATLIDQRLLMPVVAERKRRR